LNPIVCATNGGCYGESSPAIGVITIFNWNDLGQFAQTTPSGETIIASTGAVPEMSTWAMMGLGFAGLGIAGRRGIRKSQAA
jgi:hypothetical protein